MARSIEWAVAHRVLMLWGKALYPLSGRADGGREIRLSEMRRVLVTRLDEIGDVVLTGPLLRELRRNLPRAWITLLVKPEMRNLVEHCPYVDEVLTCSPPLSRWGRSLRAAAGALQIARSHLWKHDYDLAIAPRWDADAYNGAMVTYLSGAKRRLGYSERVSDDKRRANPGLDLMFTHPLHGRAPSHEVERGLDLLSSIGGVVERDHLEVWLDYSDELAARRLLLREGMRGGELLIAVAPGAGHPRRMWPISSFADLGRWAIEKCGGTLVVVGGRKEEQLGHELKRRLGSAVINAVGRTTLRQTAALMKQCALFVGGDSGPMHLAAAAGLPVVEISCHPLGGAEEHASSPVRFAPWRVPSVILQPERADPPCARACVADRAHCISSIAVERAAGAVALLLRGDRVRALL